MPTVSNAIANYVRSASPESPPKSPGTPFPASTPLSSKPKQKRNKPTLSCQGCVERKTKCDRGRPVCLACMKRQCECHYSTIADILTATEAPKSKKFRRSSQNGDMAKCSISSITNPPSPQEGPNAPKFRIAHPDTSVVRHQSVTSRERPAPFNVFGMGSQHPFHNYWTCSGGLAEVIGVLPGKEQADVLVAKYFDTVDPLYPIVWRPDFDVEYERFWALPLAEKYQFDAATLSLHFVIYATGTQFMDVLPLDERVKTAEFYLSASHQALRISSYLNRLSLPTVQTMVLICYFLVSDNHVSDSWTFSGITHRQAYALELNRDPNFVVPTATFQEKQQRCKLWQAIMYQDTGLSLYLKLPPTTQHYDIQPSCLKYNNEPTRIDSHDQTGLTNILQACLSYEALSDHDIAYLRSTWEFAAFTQTYVCIPRSLNRPLSKDPETKSRLIRQYREMYDSWPPPFNSYGPERWNITNPRLVRQLVAVSSSYFYVSMILYADDNASAGVVCDVDGSMAAGHEAMAAFFALARLWPGEVDTWWAYHTRAYAQATMIASILASQEDLVAEGPARTRLTTAKNDLDTYLTILESASGTADYESTQRIRAQDLRSIRDSITVV